MTVSGPPAARPSTFTSSAGGGRLTNTFGFGEFGGPAASAFSTAAASGLLPSSFSRLPGINILHTFPSHHTIWVGVSLVGSWIHWTALDVCSLDSSPAAFVTSRYAIGGGSHTRRGALLTTPRSTSNRAPTWTFFTS